MKITIYGVETPFDASDFSTPDFYDLREWYGPYCKATLAQGLGEPAAPQPYFTKICHELERLKAREGRDAQGWFKRIVEHYGLGWMQDSITKMKAARAAIGD